MRWPSRFPRPSPLLLIVGLPLVAGLLLVAAFQLLGDGSSGPASGASGSTVPSTSPAPSVTASASATASALPSAAASPSPSPTLAATPVPTPVPAPVPTAVPTPTPVATGPARLKLALVTGGLSDPIGIMNAGDGSGRLFVTERDGSIRVIAANGTLRAAPFVDLSDRVLGGGEQGLLGLAFHPSFETNRRLFVHYTRRSDGSGIVSELTASADGGSANPASERILLTVPDQFPNHNGGQLAFGRDGYLYIALGDGGGGGDPLGSGQSRQTLLGKILRIDVDGAHAAGKQYAIPASNPYAAAGGVSPGAGLPEIWAYGLRNPWRFSFDRSNGDLYIGDVGQGNWEEIDRQPGGSRGGENYGWNAYEGTHCYAVCSGVTAVSPITEYSHDLGCSVTGGYVYRGTSQPSLAGIYLFGDYCSGTIFSIPAGGGTHVPKPVADTGRQISSFGEGENGEIYLVDLGGGGLYRVVVDG